MHEMIQTHHLSKYYKGFPAANNISLSISKGEIYGFIGLNGAGKTTTIRMLLGMIRPTKGSCYLDGRKVNTDHRIWKKVGYLVEAPFSYPELTVQENLEIFRRLRLIPDPQAVTRVIHLLGLTRYAQKKAKDLSLGNAQRLGIAKALLHMPEILILDEPINGLDPSGIVEIRKMLRDLAFNQEVTILISSHHLSEIAQTATKIGIIHEGRLIEEIRSGELTQLLKQRLIIDTQNKNLATSELTAAGYPSFINEDGFIETTHETAVQHPDIIAHFLVYKGLLPTRLSVEEENLESYFLRIIREKGKTLQ